MSNMCKPLHELIHKLRQISWPFDFDTLPRNGVYFLCEKGQQWGHGANRPRIVRVGTHRTDGRFRERIENHYKDKSRNSVFRRQIGRALLNRNGNWREEFLTREVYYSYIDTPNGQPIDAEVTRLLRDRFSFRWIEAEKQAQRMRLEKALIGTLARCNKCGPSYDWLGRLSPVSNIRDSGLWQEKDLNAESLTKNEFAEFKRLVEQTLANDKSG